MKDHFYAEKPSLLLKLALLEYLKGKQSFKLENVILLGFLKKWQCPTQMSLPPKAKRSRKITLNQSRRETLPLYC